MNVVVKNTDVANNTVKTVHKQAPVNTVQTIVYKTLEEDDDMTASNNTVYVGNMQLNKNKVDGLMKKQKAFLLNLKTNRRWHSNSHFKHTLKFKNA